MVSSATATTTTKMYARFMPVWNPAGEPSVAFLPSPSHCNSYSQSYSWRIVSCDSAKLADGLLTVAAAAAPLPPPGVGNLHLCDTSRRCLEGWFLTPTGQCSKCKETNVIAGFNRWSVHSRRRDSTAAPALMHARARDSVLTEGSICSRTGMIQTAALLRSTAEQARNVWTPSVLLAQTGPEGPPPLPPMPPPDTQFLVATTVAAAVATTVAAAVAVVAAATAIPAVQNRGHLQRRHDGHTALGTANAVCQAMNVYCHMICFCFLDAPRLPGQALALPHLGWRSTDSLTHVGLWRSRASHMSEVSHGRSQGAHSWLASVTD